MGKVDVMMEKVDDDMRGSGQTATLYTSLQCFCDMFSFQKLQSNLVITILSDV